MSAFGDKSGHDFRIEKCPRSASLNDAFQFAIFLAATGVIISPPTE
jgi:hypothetical protein